MKNILITMLLTAAPIAVFAQIKVASDGTTSLSYQNTVAQALVSAGDGTTYAFPNTYRFGLYASSNSGTNSIGARGSAWTTSGRAIGLQGLAGCSSLSGMSFGVIGGINDNISNGAGIYGTVSNHNGYVFTGRYAGYFDGDVFISGATTISDLVTPSDMRLNENVIPLSEGDRNETLSKLLALNVIKYNYINRSKDGSDTASAKIIDVQVPDTHYGLSAQEVLKLYPDIVNIDHEGYYGIKYLELVPILIRSIQELKQELDEIKGLTARTRGTTDISQVVSNQNILYQNTPNPFKEKTIIRYKLADDIKDAYICIFDMSGKMIKNLSISSGEGQVSVGGYELGEGMFLYSLIINDQEIDTKKMIIKK